MSELITSNKKRGEKKVNKKNVQYKLDLET